MVRRRSTGTARARAMRRVLARWERSGLTLRAFGQREGIAPGTLGWWRHVLRRQGAAPQPPSSRRAGRRGAAAALAPGETALPVECFVEVRGVPGVAGAPAGGIEILLRGGHVVRVPVGIARGALREVVAALEDGC